MTPDPAADTRTEPKADDADLFGKLESLIQKHHGRNTTQAPAAIPKLSEPVETTIKPIQTHIPVLSDAVVPASIGDEMLPEILSDKRRQLQVALYLRLRQRLDHELNEALADNLRLGAIAIDPAFSRVAHELLAVLPIVVRESVEQVFGTDGFDMTGDYRGVLKS